MKNLSFILGALVILTSCDRSNANQSAIHKVILEEVLPAGQYMYLRVKEKRAEQWLALPTMEVEVGQTYYYQGGMQMPNYRSETLNRTFELVIFLERISAEPIAETPRVHPGSDYSSNVEIEKVEVTGEKAEGGITIAELFENKEDYAGKVVRIRGKVTKFNAAIMNTNWIHIQDGTQFDKYFDLTITTDLEPEVGDVVTIEGTIVLDKDFGYGYTYEVLMEDGKIIQ